MSFKNYWASHRQSYISQNILYFPPSSSCPLDSTCFCDGKCIAWQPSTAKIDHRTCSKKKKKVTTSAVSKNTLVVNQIQTSVHHTDVPKHYLGGQHRRETQIKTSSNIANIYYMKEKWSQFSNINLLCPDCFSFMICITHTTRWHNCYILRPYKKRVTWLAKWETFPDDNRWDKGLSQWCSTRQTSGVGPFCRPARTVELSLAPSCWDWFPGTQHHPLPPPYAGIGS